MADGDDGACIGNEHEDGQIVLDDFVMGSSELRVNDETGSVQSVTSAKSVNFQCDDHRTAIMGALHRLQRGQQCLDQVADVLQFFLDKDAKRQISPQYPSEEGSADREVERISDKIVRESLEPETIRRPTRKASAKLARSYSSENQGRNTFGLTAPHSPFSSPAFAAEGSPGSFKASPSKPNLLKQRSASFRISVSADHSVFSGFVTRRRSLTGLPLRVCVGNILENIVVQMISVSLILFTVLLICFDTDARARGSSVDVWVDIAMFVCFLVYLLEFLGTIFVQGRAAFRSHWNYIDGFVIATSTIEYVSSLVGVEGFTMLRLLRICRLLRLGRVLRALRLLRTVKSLKEQYLLMMMMASCVRTVCWAFIFCFFIMTIWSILAVEFLQDIVVRLDTTTTIWTNCDRCGRSFSSVWESTLTFLQTIVAGDSWGLVALPVIEDSWWSVFLFVGALSTVIFGVLNMISVVVIDTFAERRSKDLAHVATELEYEEREERRQLRKMFDRIDADASGSLSIEELHEGARQVKEFRQYLRVLDIDRNDLSDLFAMIDFDGSGEIDPDEFIDALYRLKSTESKTTTRFVKHMVDTLLERTLGIDERLEFIQYHVANKLEDVAEKLRSELEAKPGDNDLNGLLEVHVDEINTTVARAIEKAVSAAAADASTKASQAIQEVVTLGSNQIAAINGRLSRTSPSSIPPRRPSMPKQSLSSFNPCQPPSTDESDVHEGTLGISHKELSRGSKSLMQKHTISPPAGDPIVISASSKAPPPTEWFD